MLVLVILAVQVGVAVLVIEGVKVGKGVLDTVGVNVFVMVGVKVLVGVEVGGFPMIENLPETFQSKPTNICIS